MLLSFDLYSATGNTFIVFDNRQGRLPLTKKDVWRDLACRYEVDGLLFVENPREKNSDFKMRYLNCDGREAEMCGNGVCALTVFVRDKLKLPSIQQKYRLETMGGICHSQAEPSAVEMVGPSGPGTLEVGDLHPALFAFYLYTGVPHCVFGVKNLDQLDVSEVGRKICWDQRFPEGCNVNFVEEKEGTFYLRTYERGVERETLSCGTGAMAAATALHHFLGGGSKFALHSRGGILQVSGVGEKNRNLWLRSKVRWLGQREMSLPAS